MSERRILEILDKIIGMTEILQNKQIIVFGAGSIGKEVSVVLSSLNYRHFFVDNNGSLWDTKWLDIQIENPMKIKEYKKGDFIVLIASTYSMEISTQLEELSLIYEEDYYFLYTGLGYRYSTIINGVEIGKHSYGFYKHCKPGTLLKKVGAFCSINETAQMGFINHPTEFITTHPFIYEQAYGLLEDKGIQSLFSISDNQGIEIGNDVWIGAGALILPSVKIGDGAIIGAGAVVTKDIPDYAIAVGVPAKVIRYRFTDEEIEILKKIQWWNWSDEKIRECGQDFLNNEEFFLKHTKV